MKITISPKRVILPLLLAAALVIATVIVSGSTLLRIEDVTAGRILAGAYGTPDWRVQEINPLLAQILTLLYRIIPSVHWYGVALLTALLAAIAALLSIASRHKGRLIPTLVVIAPLAVLVTNAMQSTVVAALCAGVGALLLMDALQPKKSTLHQAIGGTALFVVGASLSMEWALLAGSAAVVFWLPIIVRDKRARGLLLGILTMAVSLAALYGYQSLMYSSPELSAYRSDYARYERLLHSSLHEESDELLATYGVKVYSDEEEATEVYLGNLLGSDHDHEDGDEHEAEVAAADVVIPPNSFDAVGWTINDSAMFFTRTSSDSKLTDPDVLRTLEKEATFISFEPGRLASELFATAKKPQFLLLMGIFIIVALAVVITGRNKGIIALLAALFAFGGHIFTLARYRSSFADISPYYLLALVALIYHFDGDSAKAWFEKLLAARWLRIVALVLVGVVFVAGLSGLMIYTRNNSSAGDSTTVAAAGFITPYIEAHPEMLFIGDSPYDRFKPDTLAVPARGADQSLLAGSYDLYSPRRAAMMEKFGIENPLVDCLGRSDIGYVIMSFGDVLNVRLAEHYGLYVKTPEVVLSVPGYSDTIVSLTAYSQEEVDQIIQEAKEQAELMEGMLESMLEQEAAEAAEAESGEAGDDAADGAATEPTAEPSAEPSVEPSPTATAGG